MSATSDYLNFKLESEPGEHRLLTKAPYVDPVRSLDPQRYYSREFMQLEWDRMWTRIWNFAGFACDLPEVGAYFTCELGSESVVVVRSSEREIRAFYNVCQHRGTRLVQNEFGVVGDCFTCPFHSWQYRLDGKLKRVMDRETFRAEALCGDLNLKEVRCTVLNGMVFFCMDRAAPPLEEFLGEIAEHVAAYDIPAMRVVKDVTVTWPVNWKTAADVFYEAYHVHVVHPQITGAMDDYNVQIDLYKNGMSRFLVAFGRISPRWSEQGELNDDMRAMLRNSGLDPQSFEGRPKDVRPAVTRALRQVYESKGIDCSAYHDSQLVDFWGYNFFPNVGLGLSPDGILIQRWRPHATDPGICYFDVITLAHPRLISVSPKLAYLDWAADVNFDAYVRPQRRQLVTDDDQRVGLGLVGYQDYVNILGVQAGLRSRGCEAVRLSDQEARVRHYHTELDRYIHGEG